MKSDLWRARLHRMPSLPVRGAWVEIFSNIINAICSSGRSPCGERGLKCGFTTLMVCGCVSRSPCGERGLKCPPNKERRIKTVAPRAGSVG